VAEQLGYDPLVPPESVRRLWDEGLLHEKDVLDRLFPEAERQVELRREVTAEAEIVGHPDGLLAEEVVEVQSLGDEEWRKGTGATLDRYKEQLAGYWWLAQRPVRLVEKNRSNGRDRQTVIKGDAGTEMVAAALTLRVMQAENWVGKDKLPPCDKTPTFPCPFRYLEEEKPTVTSNVETEVAKVLVANYLRWREERDSIDSLLDTCRQQLGTMFEGDKMEVGEAEVVRYDKRTTRYDWRKMKADGVDVDKYKEETVSTGIVSVRRKKDANKGGTGGN
jgi:hypothetical protein